MENSGIVFDISRFCMNDGPGIRTTVFLKGCPLRCAWCHNPESQKGSPEILFDPERCIGCGACVSVCSNGCHRLGEKRIYDRASCTGCGLCAQVCPTRALRLAGRRCTAEEVLKEVYRDKVYYEESNGGLTLSGGEPMAQSDFLETLLQMAKKEGIPTCIETCGYAPSATYRRIAPLVDCFLFDWKESDPEKHRYFTGVDNRLIRQNLELLDELGAKIVLRLPLIPGYNDTMEHLSGIADIVRRYSHISHVEILPYHPLGISKACELGRVEESKNMPVIPDKESLQNFLFELRKKVSVSVNLCI